MRKLLFIAAAFVMGMNVSAQQKPDQVAQVEESYNFGKIKQGTPVTTFFEIKNIGDKPLIIESATAGCGCTTPEYAKQPVAPNAVTKLKVGYNAANPGAFTKEVYVKFAGIPEQKVIRITGEVVDAAAYEAYTKTEDYKKWQKAQKKPKVTAKS
jgi:hypothetical protein